MTALTAERMNMMLAQIRVKYEALDEEKQVALDKDMDVDSSDHFQYQQMQAEMHASGVLEPDAAMIVYRSLGEVGSPDNGGWAKDTDTPTKVLVTQLIGELAAIKLRSHLPVGR